MTLPGLPHADGARTVLDEVRRQRRLGGDDIDPSQAVRTRDEEPEHKYERQV